MPGNCALGQGTNLVNQDQPGLLNAYDATGRLVGSRTRSEATHEGLAVGVVYLLLVNRDSRVLLQRRPKGVDNGERWDKSVGGHVDAGEDFDVAAVREAGEELFDDDASSLVRLFPDEPSLRAGLGTDGAATGVVFMPAGRHLNVRDVRHAPGGGLRNVLFHVAVFLGRTDLPLDAFRPRAGEIDAVNYFLPGEIDGMLTRGELAPNMALLWLAHGQALLDLARG